MNFSNEVIPPQGFPKYESVPMIKVDAAYWKVMKWRFLIAFIILTAVASVFFLIPGLAPARWYVAMAFLAGITARYLLQKAAFERRSYAIREHDIIYRHGILSVITTVVPFSRIQHVAVLEGFLSGKYGIAAIRVYTAGGSSADIKVAGLPKEIAFGIKEIILGKIKNVSDGASGR